MPLKNVQYCGGTSINFTTNILYLVCYSSIIQLFFSPSDIVVSNNLNNKSVCQRSIVLLTCQSICCSQSKGPKSWATELVLELSGTKGVVLQTLLEDYIVCRLCAKRRHLRGRVSPVCVTCSREELSGAASNRIPPSLEAGARLSSPALRLERNTRSQLDSGTFLLGLFPPKLPVVRDASRHTRGDGETRKMQRKKEKF